MTKPPKRRQEGPVTQADYDQELWDAWAKTIAPAKSGKPRVRVGESSNDVPSAHQTNTPISSGVQKSVQPAPEPTSPPTYRPVSSTTGQPIAPDLAEFNYKNRRRLAGGRIQIDARIDLHGMRQKEAHAALVGFLRASQQRGFRWVLAITGKGTRSSPEDSADSEFGYGDTNRGVLRRAVPQWLAQPDCRALVVSHTSAAQHHGGEGAIYIQLRSRKTRN